MAAPATATSPHGARRRAGLVAGVVTVLLLAGGGYAAYLRYGRVQEPPLPLWRDGVIAAIRNCERPGNADHLQQCAVLHCLQRVTQELEYPVESKVSLEAVTALAGGGFEVTGRLVPFPLRADSPNVFTCVMPDHLRAEAQFQRLSSGAKAAGAQR